MKSQRKDSSEVLHEIFWVKYEVPAVVEPWRTAADIKHQKRIPLDFYLDFFFDWCSRRGEYRVVSNYRHEQEVERRIENKTAPELPLDVQERCFNDEALKKMSSSQSLGMINSAIHRYKYTLFFHSSRRQCEKVVLLEWKLIKICGHCEKLY